MNKLNQNKERTEKKEKLTKDTMVILASNSETRKQILKYYKINFKAVPHTIDEGEQKKNINLFSKKNSTETSTGKSRIGSKKIPEKHCYRIGSVIGFSGKNI